MFAEVDDNKYIYWFSYCILLHRICSLKYIYGIFIGIVTFASPRSYHCITLWYYGQYDEMRHINPFRNLCILPLASIIMTYQTQAKDNQWPQHVTSWCHRFPQSNLYTSHCIRSFCMVYWSGIARLNSYRLIWIW